jgi:tRNA A-37 threonylcarbamoyl transferase component Bud32
MTACTAESFESDAGEDETLPLEEKDLLAPGTALGRYFASHLIGAGGQALVYEGEHAELGYPVAIKVLRATDISELQRARVRREARALAQLKHPHIVRVLDVGDLPDGSPFLVMEHVEGMPLSRHLPAQHLSPGACVELGLQLLSALCALHEKEIVHRDIKPENVMLERQPDGQICAKLLDFGISKSREDELTGSRLTHTGTIVGTPHYMPPEHVRGEVLDVRADLYAVAGVLYEAICGRPPRDAPTTAAVIAQIATEEVRPLRDLEPACPKELADVIDRGLRSDRDKRWAHPMQMAEALREAARVLSLPRGADAWAQGGARSPRETAEWELRRKKPISAPTPLATIEPARPPRFRARYWIAAASALVLGTLATVAFSQTGVRVIEQARKGSAASKGDVVETILFNAAAEPLPIEEVEPEPAPERPEPSLAELERSARNAFVRGEAARAAVLYRRAIARAPTRATAWRGLGLVLAASGERSLARRALHRYLSLAPEAEDRARIEREIARLD